MDSSQEKRRGGTSDLPPGTPRWISPELVQETIETWTPYYPEPVTTQQAIEILVNVARLVHVLRDDAA